MSKREGREMRIGFGVSCRESGACMGGNSSGLEGCDWPRISGLRRASRGGYCFCGNFLPFWKQLGVGRNTEN